MSILTRTCILASAALVIALAPTPAAGEDEKTSASASIGKATFREYCRACHGDQARGDGPVAKTLRPRPADLTGIRGRNDGVFPAELVYAAISEGEDIDGHGNSEMPVWGSAFSKVRGGQTDEEVDLKIRSLVAFLESIQE